MNLSSPSLAKFRSYSIRDRISLLYIALHHESTIVRRSAVVFERSQTRQKVWLNIVIDKPKANSTANQGLAFGEFCAVLKCVGDENYQNCAEALFYPGEKWGEMAERALVSNSYWTFQKSLTSFFRAQIFNLTHELRIKLHIRTFQNLMEPHCKEKCCDLQIFKIANFK